MRRLLERASAKLRDAGVEEPRAEAELIFAHALNVDRSWLYAHDDEPVDVDIAPLIERRCRREPLAYILGRREFYGLTFAVTPRVLIPRPETELLVELALERLTGAPSPFIVDVGVGSGAILLSLLKNLPTARGLGIDISSAALRVAQANAVNLGLADRAEFVQGDLLSSPPSSLLTPDCIVSNPPYIRRDELATLSPEVRCEPAIALDGGGDGLGLYRRLLPQAKQSLAPDGFLAVEIGSTQGADVRQLARGSGFSDVRLFKDLAGLDRVVIMS